MYPKLRAVQPNLIQHEGNPYIMLKDPLQLAEGTILVPQSLAPLLALCDGTRNLGALRTGFELRTSIPLNESVVEQVINHLDQALLLDNERSAQACDAALSQFRTTPARPPALAGGGYPADPGELNDMLRSYIEAIPEYEERGDNVSSRIRGVISPHIDFHRGGPVYAEVWSKAAETIRDIELAIIFGTNHLGGRNLFTLTKQDYSTPWGTLPTAGDIVDRIANSLGEENAFEDELHHRNEHSIELALVWLHYFLGDRKCELVPILCGSFEQFTAGYGDPGQDTDINGIIDSLIEMTKGRRTLVVAAADLAHMGPAFGDNYPIDTIRRAGIKASDDGLINAICSADAEGFFEQIKNERDARRICGLAPIYMTLRVLGTTEGDASGYMQCPADAINASLVSICGVILR